MPTTYWRYQRPEFFDDGTVNVPPASIYRVSCTRCGTYVDQDGPSLVDATAQIFRWVNSASGGRYNSRCRACERALRRAAATTRRPSSPRRSSRSRPSLVANADRRFGVEIEARFSNNADRHTIQRALYEAGLHDWSVKTDCSIRGNGWEVVSPPISGDAGRDQVRVACRVLREQGGSVDTSCGLHIHHEVRDLDHPALRRVARSWANNQRTIDGLVSSSRRGRPTYCEEFVDRDAREVELARDPGRVGLSRYKALNFTSYGRYGTLEVRQHQGTLSANKIIAWLDFAQALFHEAARLEEPVIRTTTIGDLLGRLPSLPEDAAAFLIGRASQLGHVPVGTAPAVA